ncbi:MAG: FmdB family zinc ribbon protein [Desulfovibrionales bacterium]
MPIYEFYCGGCHTIYSFFSTSVNTTKRPDCPGCGRAELERQVSVFSVGKRRDEALGDGMDDLDIDESRMEKAMQMLASEAESMNEEDPRQAAQIMRKISEAAGIQLGPGMEEAMRRMEAGEDPEAIEAEMGDVLENEEPLMASAGRKVGLRRSLPPTKDETIYDL